jgi:hypothetical protein
VQKVLDQPEGMLISVPEHTLGFSIVLAPPEALDNARHRAVDLCVSKQVRNNHRPKDEPCRQ